MLSSYDIIERVMPEEQRKVLVNIRKREERKLRLKQEATTEDGKSQGSKNPEAIIKEDENQDPIDFLSPENVHRMIGCPPRYQLQAHIR